MMPARQILKSGAVFAMLAAGTVPAAANETRTYVVSAFFQGASSTDGDCAGGINPVVREQDELNLVALGKTPAEAKALIDATVDDDTELRRIMNDRGRIDGRPVNAYAHPAAVADPGLKSVTGNIGFGFDLDGQGAEDPDGFIDPDTGEKGIDNQAFRALGCSRPYRGTKDNPGAYWAFLNIAMKDSSPAWLISVSGADLGKDGPITVTFDRALEHPKSNPDGQARPYMTYRVDPDPRSHNEFKGEIKDGILTITDHKPFFMNQAFIYAPHIQLRHTHLRLDMTKGDGLDGFIGGYQPWRDVYFGVGSGGRAAETTVAGETPGLFYLLRKNADSNPDPQTGENRDISITYRLMAVPAFHVHVGHLRGRVDVR
jgi:hypothetical protein